MQKGDGSSACSASDDWKTCCSCRNAVPPEDIRQVQKTDVLKGTVDQWRCKRCVALLGRLARLTKGTGTPCLRDLTAEERTEFMKSNQNLFGKDLQKAITDINIQARLRKSGTTFSQHGDFIDIEGEDGVKAKYSNRPDQLANILERGQRITCPVRGVEAVWVPKYTLNITDEEHETDETKRKMQADYTIKKAKVSKLAKQEPPPTNTDGEGDQEDKDKRMVNIGVGQKKRIEKIIPKLEDQKLKPSSNIGVISAPDMQGHIGQKQLDKYMSIESNLTDTVSKLKEAFAQQTAPAGHVAKLLKSVAETAESAATASSRLDELLQEAA